MAKTFRQLLSETKGAIPEVTPEEAKARGERGEALLLDVREKDEFVQGHLPKALFIPRGFLELRVEEKVPDKKTPIVVYCAGGTRSLLAARSLKELGYDAVASMAGGFGRW